MATSQLVKGEVPRKMAVHRSPAVVVLHPGAEEIHSPRVVSRFIENVGHRVHRHAAARLADKRPLRQTARLLELVQLLQTKGTEREKVPVITVVGRQLIEEGDPLFIPMLPAAGVVKEPPLLEQNSVPWKVL